MKSLFLLIVLYCTVFNSTALATEKIPVFVSILPQAFFVEQIGGQRVTVDVLVLPGQSPATYTPTPKQMAKLAQAKVFFRIGVAFENVFMPKIANSMDTLPIVDTRQGINLQSMEYHQHRDEHHHENDLDPHIWLDPMLVKLQGKIIRDTLAGLDPAGKVLYHKNFETFSKELDRLHDTLSQTLSTVKGKTFFVFHPAFGYFAKAYGLKQVAVETGGKKPSGRHLSRLIESARNKKVKVLFVQQQFSRKSAETIAEAIDGVVVAIDPLAKDYFNNMEKIAREIRSGMSR